MSYVIVLHVDLVIRIFFKINVSVNRIQWVFAVPGVPGVPGTSALI